MNMAGMSNKEFAKFVCGLGVTDGQTEKESVQSESGEVCEVADVPKRVHSGERNGVSRGLAAYQTCSGTPSKHSVDIWA